LDGAAGYTRRTMAGAGLEIEIKLRVEDAAEMARRLRRLRARSAGRVHERNTLFDTPENSLGRSGRVLRVRSIEEVLSAKAGRGRSRKGGRNRRIHGVLTYKTPVEGSRYKVRQETEVTVCSPEQAERILEGLGFRPWFRYEKFRTTYRLPGLPRLVIDLDETPIGVYLELEGPPGSIDRAARRLGYGPGDYLRESYYELFERERERGGFERGRMLFPGKH
jgi:adenylate cyclase, class 2